MVGGKFMAKANKEKSSFLKETKGDKVFHAINIVFLLLCFVVIALPLLNVISQSVSSPRAVIAGKVTFLPVDFNIDAYKQIFKNSMLIRGYGNSILYTVLGTCINLVMTVMAAYPLSRKDFVGRNIFMAMFVFCMVFTAPLIPVYLNIKSYGMLDSIWAMVIPGAVSVYNMIIARTFFQTSIPDEMIEAAELDGANDLVILLRLVLPLSKSILAVLLLFYAVTHWNAYFDGLIYLSTQEKFPLQVVLRNILSNAASLSEMSNMGGDQSQNLALVEVLKYAIIVFGSLPVLVLYPFVQKHFVKGVMIGSVKG